MGVGALASEIAAEIHGLEVLARDVEDHGHNTTRFLVMAPEADLSRRGGTMLTTFIFEVRNIPAALYKAMGGFATNGVNMTKLESYMVGGSFTATQFYADIEGHPEDPAGATARWRSWAISPTSWRSSASTRPITSATERARTLQASSRYRASISLT